ncbi:MAG: ADP-ribosylglycohydrolase family protein [Actinobacteria bacterium]|nr:ADP-ribosylglycohydrolase family protein [Actinomycetota bacterium]
MNSRDRAIGALVGLAVGDAVGTTLEFKQPGSFEPITDMVGGGPFRLQPGEWTDDTSMAMCLAESILDTDEIDPADELRRYVAWCDDGYWSSTGRCFDIGGTTRAALRRFADTGTVTDADIDPEAAANGSLMRLAPVPIRWFTDPAGAARAAGESSRTTHPADRPVDACRAYAAMIAAVIGGTSLTDVLDGDFWEFGQLDPRVEAVVRGSWRTKEPPEIRGTGYVVDALEAALWAVAGAQDFRDAILRAANLGDDADTTAAITGQLAGAQWGVGGIPAGWRSAIRFGPRIESIAGRLHDRGAGIPGLSQSWEHDDDVHAYWVEPDRILAGEYPGDADPERAAAKIDVLVDAGIRTFVDLTCDGLRPYGDDLARVSQRRGLDLVRVARPIPAMSVGDVEAYRETVTVIGDAASRGGVYVHCQAGIGRTATVVGCLLVDAGASPTAALARIAALRAPTRKTQLASPQTADQRGLIVRFAAIRRPDEQRGR